MAPTVKNRRAHLAGDPDLSDAKPRAALAPTPSVRPFFTCLVELIGVDELLGVGQGSLGLSLILQELQQLRGAQHAVLSRVPMEDLLQLRAFQQPPQKFLNLRPLQPLIFGVVTLLEGRRERLRRRQHPGRAGCSHTHALYTPPSSTTAGTGGDVSHFTGGKTELARPQVSLRLTLLDRRAGVLKTVSWVQGLSLCLPQESRWGRKNCELQAGLSLYAGTPALVRMPYCSHMFTPRSMSNTQLRMHMVQSTWHVRPGVQVPWPCCPSGSHSPRVPTGPRMESPPLWAPPTHRVYTVTCGGATHATMEGVCSRVCP